MRDQHHRVSAGTVFLRTKDPALFRFHTEEPEIIRGDRLAQQPLRRSVSGQVLLDIGETRQAHERPAEPVIHEIGYGNAGSGGTTRPTRTGSGCSAAVCGTGDSV